MCRLNAVQVHTRFGEIASIHEEMVLTCIKESGSMQHNGTIQIKNLQYDVGGRRKEKTNGGHFDEPVG